MKLQQNLEGHKEANLDDELTTFSRNDFYMAVAVSLGPSNSFCLIIRIGVTPFSQNPLWFRGSTAIVCGHYSSSLLRTLLEGPILTRIKSGLSRSRPRRHALPKEALQKSKA